MNVDTAHPNILVENPGIVRSGCEWFGVCFPFVLDWVNESVLCDWLVLMPVLTGSQQARKETPERRALREKLDDFFLRGSSRSWESTEMMDDQPDERHDRRDTSETRTDRDAGAGGRSSRSFGEMKVRTWKGGCLKSRWWRPPKAGAMKEH